MLKLTARSVAAFAAVLLLAACNRQPDQPSVPSANSLAISSPVAPTFPPPQGNSFKNCRGGRNIHWWISHIEGVTADDLLALAGLNLLNADGSPFDPDDSAALASWLRASGRSDELVYALSGQLAVSTLNVRHGYAPDAGTFVVRDQANGELGLENPSTGWMETLLSEFERCQ